jgi:hypothetical protein
MTVDLSLTANRCPECGAAELYTRQTHAPGGDKYGSVLDGLGGIFSHPTVNVVICARCGLLRLFADPGALGEVRSHKDWKRIP